MKENTKWKCRGKQSRYFSEIVGKGSGDCSPLHRWCWLGDKLEQFTLSDEQHRNGCVCIINSKTTSLHNANHGLTLCTLYFLVPFAGISLIRFYGSHFRGLSLLGYQWSTPTSCLSQFGLLLKQPALRIPFYYIFNFTGNTSTTRKLNEYSSSWLAADLPCKAEVQWLCRACVR